MSDAASEITGRIRGADKSGNPTERAVGALDIHRLISQIGTLVPAPTKAWISALLRSAWEVRPGVWASRGASHHALAESIGASRDDGRQRPYSKRHMQRLARRAEQTGMVILDPKRQAGAANVWFIHTDVMLSTAEVRAAQRAEERSAGGSELPPECQPGALVPAWLPRLTVHDDRQKVAEVVRTTLEAFLGREPGDPELRVFVPKILALYRRGQKRGGDIAEEALQIAAAVTGACVHPELAKCRGQRSDGAPLRNRHGRQYHDYSRNPDWMLNVEQWERRYAIAQMHLTGGCGCRHAARKVEHARAANPVPSAEQQLRELERRRTFLSREVLPQLALHGIVLDDGPKEQLARDAAAEAWSTVDVPGFAERTRLWIKRGDPPPDGGAVS